MTHTSAPRFATRLATIAATGAAVAAISGIAAAPASAIDDDYPTRQVIAGLQMTLNKHTKVLTIRPYTSGPFAVEIATVRRSDGSTWLQLKNFNAWSTDFMWPADWVRHIDMTASDLDDTVVNNSLRPGVFRLGEGDDTFGWAGPTDDVDLGPGDDTLSVVRAGHSVTNEHTPYSATLHDESGRDTVTFESCSCRARVDGFYAQTFTPDGNFTTGDGIRSSIGFRGVSIEEVRGSSRDDELSTDARVVRGNGGDDFMTGAGTLYGDRGNDRIYTHGNGASVLHGGEGNDRLAGGGGSDRLYGGPGNDNLSGKGGADQLHGESGADWLVGGDGDDRMYGGTGDDMLIGGAGADHIVGNWGTDAASYSSSDTSVRVTLDGVANDGAFTRTYKDKRASYRSTERDNVGRDVEKVYGSRYDDQLLGSSAPNQLYGGDGNDYLRGYGGDDRLVGSAGNDTLFGDAGKDLLLGYGGYDRAYGGEQYDRCSAEYRNSCDA